MTYLIIDPSNTPFYTNWFDPENHFIQGMIVINLLKGQYSINGFFWLNIEEDFL